MTRFRYLITALSLSIALSIAALFSGASESFAAVNYRSSVNDSHWKSTYFSNHEILSSRAESEQETHVSVSSNFIGPIDIYFEFGNRIFLKTGRYSHFHFGPALSLNLFEKLLVLNTEIRIRQHYGARAKGATRELNSFETWSQLLWDHTLETGFPYVRTRFEVTSSNLEKRLWSFEGLIRGGLRFIKGRDFTLDAVTDFYGYPESVDSGRVSAALRPGVVSSYELGPELKFSLESGYSLALFSNDSGPYFTAGISGQF